MHEWMQAAIVGTVALGVGWLFGALWSIGLVARTMERNHIQLRDGSPEPEED